MIGLEYIRTLNQDTCESLAEKLNITKSVVSNWENQKKAIPQKRIAEIAALYNVKPEYITKELTRLEELILQREKLKKDIDGAMIEVPDYDYNDKGEYVEIGTHLECGIAGAEKILRSINEDIKEEKLIQGIRNFLNSIPIDGNVSFDNYIMFKQTHIQLVKVFLSLCNSKNTNEFFLMSVLRAVQRSEDLTDEWGESNPMETAPSFVDKLCNVMREYRKEQEQLKNQLFGSPDDSEGDE